MPDVTVIGAGPAGSVASIFLARRGWRVTLLEQHRFPREKVCGECLSALGIDVLTRLDLKGDIASLHPMRLRRSIFIAPSGQDVAFDLPREMWGVPRDILDDRLLSAARDAGAELLDLHRCEHIAGGVYPVVRARDLRTNELRQWTPQYVIVADGKGAFDRPRRKQSGDLGFKAHFADVAAPHDAILLLGVTGHYIGVAAVGPNQWNLAMSVKPQRLRACDGDGDRLMELIKPENDALATMFRRARRTSDWLAAPLPRFAVAMDWPRRVIPIGNAAAALEPIGGEGMGLAMRSAELAAEELANAVQRDTEPDVAALRSVYHSLWKTRARACRLTALAISQPMVAELAVQAARSSDVVAWMGMKLVGK